MSVRCLEGEPELEAVVRSLADVQLEKLNWLWPWRIANGKFTLMVGDPGLGKSLVALDIAARVSRGVEWPEGSSSAPQGSVLLLNGEDDVADTVVPRLTALGADLSQIKVVEGVRTPDGRQETSFTLAHHLEQLEWALVGMENPRLVVIDPISSFLRGLDSNSNAVVRRMLGQLGDLAQRWQISILAVTHFAKDNCGYSLRGAFGSMAFVAAARGVWLVAPDPLDSSRRLLLQLKNNLGRCASGLAFRMDSSECEAAPVVQWESEPVKLTADEIVKLARTLMRNSDQILRKAPREEAAECLAELLADGPRMGRHLLSDAEKQGFAERTIRRALRDMGAQARRCDMGEYYYSLPGQEKDVPETDVWLWLKGREMAREMG